MKVIIAGCGRVGAELADMLSLDGHEVTVMDKDPRSFQRLSKLFSGEVVEGFAYDEESLTKAGIRYADAFAAVTNFDNTNLMAAEVARKIFNVPRVIARLYNTDKEQTYQALEIDYVCGTKLLAQVLQEKILRPQVRVRDLCCNNTLSLVEFDCPAKWSGKKVGRLEEEITMHIAFLVRDGEAIFPHQDFSLEKGDEVTALISTKRMNRLERKLRGREGRW